MRRYTLSDSGGAGLALNERLSSRIVRKYLVPSVLAQLGMKTSLLINAAVLGRLLGDDGLAAVSAVAPADFAFMAAGSLIGVGAGVNSAVAAGEGDAAKAGRFYSLAFAASLAAGLALSAALFVFAPQAAALLGATESNRDVVSGYLRFYAPGGVFVILMYIPLNYLRLIGSANGAMGMLLLMSGVNAALSLFLGGFLRMGAAGVALGASAGYMCAFVFGQALFARAKSGFTIRRPDMSLARLRAVLSAGAGSALNNILRAVQTAGINRLLASRGAEAALPAYALCGTALGVANAVVFGVSQALLPLAAIAYGERDFKMAARVARMTLGAGAAVVGALAAALFAGRDAIGAAFGLDGADARASARIAFACLAASLLFYLVNNVASNLFTATKRPKPASAVVVARLFVFSLVPACLLYGVIGENAVWLSFLSGEALTLLAIGLYIRAKRRRNPWLSPFMLLDGSLAGGSEIIEFSARSGPEAAADAAERAGAFCAETKMSPKQAMAVSLALEELIALAGRHALAGREGEYVDIRIVKTGERVVTRLRYGGAEYNPIERYRLDKDRFGDYMGVAMIAALARNVEYNRAYGVNNLVVEV